MRRAFKLERVSREEKENLKDEVSSKKCGGRCIINSLVGDLIKKEPCGQ